MLTLGTGVGGGLILDNRLYRGAVGAAGELGHITLDLNGLAARALPGKRPPRSDGVRPLGGQGRRARRARAARRRSRRAAAAGRLVDPRLLVELASAGPGDARDALEHIGFHLGVGISIQNVFNPESSSSAEASPRRYSRWGRAASRGRAHAPPARDVVAIVEAELGPDAGLVGAALVAFDALDEE